MIHKGVGGNHEQGFPASDQKKGATGNLVPRLLYYFGVADLEMKNTPLVQGDATYLTSTFFRSVKQKLNYF